jgi:sugar fermentation stimulation protein
MKILLKIENYEKGVIIERLNRFVVKVKIKNRLTLTHLNNTGRLEDFLKKGKVGLFLPINADYADFTQTAQTKLKFRLSMVQESKNIYSIIDTSLQMKCLEIALEKGYISWLKGAKILKRNFRINHSLIDYLIEHKNKKYLIEVKSAVMKYKNCAMYPDCSSIRGQKHIKELINIQSTRITDRINYPNKGPNKLPESSDRIIITRIKYRITMSTRIIDRIESTRITRPNNIPEYKPNKNIHPNDNRINYPNNRPNGNEIFGQHSGKVFGQNSGNSFGPHSGSDIEFGYNLGNEFGIDSGKIFGQDSSRNINPRLSALYPYKSMVLFIAGMKNISAFSPNKNADPKIYELLKIAKKKGVKIKAIQIYFDEKRKSVILKNDNLPVIL